MAFGLKMQHWIMFPCFESCVGLQLSVLAWELLPESSTGKIVRVSSKIRILFKLITQLKISKSIFFSLTILAYSRLKIPGVLKIPLQLLQVARWDHLCQLLMKLFNHFLPSKSSPKLCLSFTWLKYAQPCAVCLPLEKAASKESVNNQFDLCMCVLALGSVVGMQIGIRGS